MANLLSSNPAPGGPGVAATWTRADKDAVGTARSSASQVWFTVAGGIVTEVYFPDVDTPQIRDFQLMFTDGVSFFHDAQRNFTHQCTPIDPRAPAFRVTSTSTDNQHRYTVIQDIITSADSSCLLVRVQLQGDANLLGRLKVYALLAPHLQGLGASNSGHVAVTPNGKMLVAQRGDCWLALDANCGLGQTSCGFVGVNDGWTDIIGGRRLPVYEYDCAQNGNIALTAEIDRGAETEFVLALGFCENDEGQGTQPNSAMVAVTEALSYPFDQVAPPGQLQAYVNDWVGGISPTRFQPVAGTTGDQDRLFDFSHAVLLSHEDKNSLGAVVASLSIPWGYVNSDDDAGYHLVWPRDMCQSATALMAAGEMDLPLRGLMFLATNQSPDGGFNQNFYVNGSPHWTGTQLDEISYPIILAWRLSQANALQRFDPKRMVLAAAGALIAKGPMTQEERWEENEGYSPSTLASNIAGLVCAADLAERSWGDAVTAQFLREYADFLESHLETWCVTTQGGLVPGISKHYIRLLPTQVKSGGSDRNPSLPEDPDTATINLKNILQGAFLARDIVDGGFQELVRFGIRSADDPIIKNSIQVIDAVLKDDLPNGPCYRRYNHDGYGQGDQDQPFGSQGVGRPWPLLTGERAHYEVAAGRDANPYIRYLEAFAGARGLIAEQLWNGPALPDADPPLEPGGPTGSAMPLAWAHAEYIKLVRSVSDGRVFDLIPVVADRYRQPHTPSPLEVWNFDRQFLSMKAGKTVRIPLATRFSLHWTHDGGNSWQDTAATATAVGIFYADLPTQAAWAGSALEFTFFWLSSQTWEGANFSIGLHP
jgi:glucoamylase